VAAWPRILIEQETMFPDNSSLAWPHGRAGNALEIMYNPVDDNTISIFHAMKARNSFVKMLGLRFTD
jgi:hypothetical protein